MATDATMWPDQYAQDARQESLERYQAAIGASAHVIVVLDEVGTIIDVSDAVTHRLGYAVSDLIGRSAFEFVHPSDQQRVVLELVREIEVPAVSTESIIVRILHGNGSWIDAEMLGVNWLNDPAIGGVVVSVRDISGRPMSERILAAGEYLYTAMPTVASDATAIFDAEARRVYTSASLERMLGFSHTEMLAITSEGLVHPDDLHLWCAAADIALAAENGTARTECRLIGHGGSVVWIEATVVNLLGDSGVRGIVVHIRNIDDRRQMEHELRRRATQDSLTGLANRFALMEQLSLLDAADFDPAGVAVLFCDLDGFKQINDSHGHSVGDEVLTWVAHQIRSVARAGQFQARIGGDEFCVLCTDVESIDEALAVARSYHNAITAPAGNGHCVGVSIGVSWAHPRSRSGDELLILADRAMYKAKRCGTFIESAH